MCIRVEVYQFFRVESWYISTILTTLSSEIVFPRKVDKLLQDYTVSHAKITIFMGLHTLLDSYVHGSLDLSVSVIGRCVIFRRLLDLNANSEYENQHAIFWQRPAEIRLEDVA
jgi:hypothetical protein